MGYFYIDESIHDKAGFIIAAIVYTELDISEDVFLALKNVGLHPKKDEFKSSILTSNNQQQQVLRNDLRSILYQSRIALVVVPNNYRMVLGQECLRGLQKILHANDFNDLTHQVFFDQGIIFKDHKLLVNQLRGCEFNFEQDSKLIGGLQLADLAAHTMSIMLLETLGIINKTVKVPKNSGYDPDSDMRIGFELWAGIRHNFFNGKYTQNNNLSVEQMLTINLWDCAVHLSDNCSQLLREAVHKRFGSTYLGCIH